VGVTGGIMGEFGNVVAALDLLKVASGYDNYLEACGQIFSRPYTFYMLLHSKQMY